MTTSCRDFLDRIGFALGDRNAETWSRTDHWLPWTIEAVMTFHILRPMVEDHTIGATEAYGYDLPADFREVISVEYPINQQPPEYLLRKNRLDPDFYIDSSYYDIDHNYTDGRGWTIYFSGLKTGHVKVQYLANHDTALTDSDESLLTIPDEYIGILIAMIVCRAYRERLSAYMRDPTAHTNLIYQMTEMVKRAEDNYNQLLSAAVARLANSNVSPRQKSDKFDRVY